MSSLILPRRFTQQPQGAVKVDWSNPLLKDFFYICLGNAKPFLTFYDRNGKVYITSAPTGRVTPGGIGSQYTGAASGAITGTAGMPHNSRSLWLYANSVTSGDAASTYIDNASGTHVRVNNGTWDASVRTYAATYATPSIAKGAGLASGFLTWDQPNNLATLYVDGASPVSVATTSTWDINTQSVQVFGGNASALLIGGLATGVLSQSVQGALSANPWQIFRAKPRVLYFDASTGSSFPSLSSITASNFTTSGARLTVN